MKRNKETITDVEVFYCLAPHFLATNSGFQYAILGFRSTTVLEHVMVTLQFNQILPSQKMPVLAKNHVAAIPSRAKAFCHPFKAAKNEGVYFFPPLNFEFKLTDEQFLLHTKTTSGDYRTNTVTKASNENQFILLSDIEPEQSDSCLKVCRERIANDNQLPDFIDVDKPICQAVGYPGVIEQLHNIPMAQIEDKWFLQPLRWHVYDPNYGLKAGKYQRMIKKAP
jgi:hypothetical protein